MKTLIHIKIAAVTICLVVAGWADDSIRRPAITRSWKVGSTAFTLLNDGTLTVSGKLGGISNSDPTLFYNKIWRSAAPSVTGLVINEGTTHVVNFFLFSNVKLPDNAVSVALTEFNGCGNLKSVTIPSSVTVIEAEAFLTLDSPTSIIVAADNVHYSSEDGVLFNKDKTVLVRYPRGKQGAYTIPNSVTSIGDHAFRRCNGLTSVTIPNGVTSIGTEAFYECENLKSVTISGTVAAIEKRTFFQCRDLTSVTIEDGVKSIGEDAFNQCESLTSVVIPNSVASIGERAFHSCGALTSLTLPNSVKTIGNDAFSYGGLTSITIPNSVIEFGRNAFEGCKSLKSVTIEEGVRSIGDHAFAYTPLTSVTIPRSVTEIGLYAFDKTDCLMSMTILNPVPPNLKSSGYHSWESKWYRGVHLYVPENSVDAYRANTWWNAFSDIHGIADDAKKVNGVMGVSWPWLVLIILTATVIDIVRRGIRYNQKNMKNNRP